MKCFFLHLFPTAITPILAIIIFLTNVEENFFTKADNFFFAHIPLYSSLPESQKQRKFSVSKYSWMAYILKIFFTNKGMMQPRPPHNVFERSEIFQWPHFQFQMSPNFCFRESITFIFFGVNLYLQTNKSRRCNHNHSIASLNSQRSFGGFISGFKHSSDDKL